MLVIDSCEVLQITLDIYLFCVYLVLDNLNYSLLKLFTLLVQLSFLLKYVYILIVVYDNKDIITFTVYFNLLFSSLYVCNVYIMHVT